MEATMQKVLDEMV
jgi:hypothetical protein